MKTGLEIGKVVGSNDQADYLVQVHGPGDVPIAPAPTEHAFGQFVEIPVDDANRLVGIIYTTQLFNPSYGALGPRLSTEQELPVFSPDYLAETATIVGVAPETISVWKRHPQWQLELTRWRALAEVPLDATEQRHKFESLTATIAAFEQLQQIMENATKRVRTSSGIREEPDYSTQLKAARLILAGTIAAFPDLYGAVSKPDRRTLRIVP